MTRYTLISNFCTSASEPITKGAFSAVRNIQVDELTLCLATDKISYHI